VDILVAVRDEEESLPFFVDRVRGLELPRGVELRMVFVEDSSRDDTVGVLRRLSHSDPRIAYYCLEEGFGQGAAIVFGLSHSSADAAIMMDGDLSHPPEAIPHMVKGYLDGAEVVQCVRRSLPDRTPIRRWGQVLFQRAVALLTGVDGRRQSTYFRLVSQPIAAQLLRSPRYWRFLRFPLPPTEGGALRILEVDCVERSHGASKYDFGRLLGLAVDGLLSQMSRWRISGYLLAQVMVAALAWWMLSGLVGLVILASALWLGWRWSAMDRWDPLEQMVVTEHSDERPRVSPEPVRSA